MVNYFVKSHLQWLDGGVWSIEESLIEVLVDICLFSVGTCGIGLDNPVIPVVNPVNPAVKGEPFVGFWVGEVGGLVILLLVFPKVRDLFFIIVSPSGVMIFLGHLLSLVCLMRPFL